MALLAIPSAWAQEKAPFAGPGSPGNGAVNAVRPPIEEQGEVASERRIQWPDEQPANPQGNQSRDSRIEATPPRPDSRASEPGTNDNSNNGQRRESGDPARSPQPANGPDKNPIQPPPTPAPRTRVTSNFLEIIWRNHPEKLERISVVGDAVLTDKEVANIMQIVGVSDEVIEQNDGYDLILQFADGATLRLTQFFALSAPTTSGSGSQSNDQSKPSQHGSSTPGATKRQQFADPPDLNQNPTF